MAKHEKNWPFYRAGDSKVGDVMPCYFNDRFYLYYLRFSEEKPNVWSARETTDFVHYTDDIRTNVRGGTGEILAFEGKYHIFKAEDVLPGGVTAINHYIGDTPYEFVRQTDRIPSDCHYYVPWAWRDPRVIWVEEEQCFWMLVATNQKDGAPPRRHACVGLLKSKDLKEWEYFPPLFAPQSHEGTYECPDMFMMGDWYYLVYSNANQDKMTHYVKSRSRSGPWEIPKDDTLDSFLFYAGRVAGDDRQRIIAAWNAERTGNDLGPKFGLRDVVKCDMIQKEDFAPLGYAGDMVIHQIGQFGNGDIRLMPVSQIASEFSRKKTTGFEPLYGAGWDVGNDRFSTESVSLYTCASVSDLPERCLIRFGLKADCREAGVALGTDRSFCDKGYYLRFEPRKGRMQAMTGLREGFPWIAYCLPYAVEEEVFAEPDNDGYYHVEIIRAGELATVYVNGKALSLRSANMTGDLIGIYVFDGKAEFTGFEILETE
ncbi:MAG: hypothetical protein IJU75_05040 [Clostridia bacterium]|nr:hypothetical protein [Clostridia bacterium]